MASCAAAASLRGRPTRPNPAGFSLKSAILY
jgi:hypothetical protein